VTAGVNRRIFCGIFNIGFRLPATDTCKLCDQLNAAITSADDTNESEIENELAEHTHKADAAFALLKTASRNAKEDTDEVHTVCFDLQQVESNNVMYLRVTLNGIQQCL
jgi:hypothetical protein